MAHPETDPQPEPGTNYGTQQGVGQGTIGRRRRKPRKEVNDVEVSTATGLSLGPDGNYHPIETDSEGNLKVRVKGISDLLQEIVDTNRAIVRALAEAHDLDFDELFDC